MSEENMPQIQNPESHTTMHSTNTIMIISSLEEVGPSEATKLLLTNTHNRTTVDSRVRAYARDMKAGRWKMNGETIQIGQTGVLLNGQHRLLAVVESQTVQKFLIVRGLPEDSQSTMDQGLKRTLSDQMILQGIHSDTNLAAALRLFIRWESNRLFGQKQYNNPSDSEVLEWALNNTDKMEFLYHIKRDSNYRKVPATPSVILALAFKLYRLDYETAQEFFSSLHTGAGLDIGSPILVLRNRLFKAKEQKTRLTERDVMGLVIMSWNAWREDKKITKLHLPRSGWTIDNFPTPL